MGQVSNQGRERRGYMSKDHRSLGWTIGIAVFGGAITGIVAIVVGIATALTGEAVGAGLALVGAALSFGLLANALLRA
jgi:hypothetical protein